ncbi:MAG TPA: XdhC family protein [Thermoanaerobaculia bacterium]|nr:XdhC family protein [Thermoanaerobaculia bacterium]
MHELQRIHDAVHALLTERKAGLLVTVIGTRGSTYRRPGARSVIGEDGSVTGAISGGCVERDIALRAKAWVSDFEPRVVTYDSSSAEDIVFGLGLGCRGKIEMIVQPFDAVHPPALPPVPAHDRVTWTTTFEGRVVLEENIEPQRAVAIFGRGPDVEPVAAVAEAIGWRAEIIRSWDEPDLSGFHAVVIMTHNFLHDVALVQAAFASDAEYIGLLGPKSRGEEILTQVGVVTPDMRHRLHSPAGLDLGGETPEAIALSIVAEIQTVFQDATGEPLREKDGPIHTTVIPSVARDLGDRRRDE